MEPNSSTLNTTPIKPNSSTLNTTPIEPNSSTLNTTHIEPNSRKSILSVLSAAMILLSQGLRLKQIRYVFSEMLKFVATVLENPLVVKSVANTLRGLADLIEYDNVGQTMSDCIEAVGHGIEHIPPPPDELTEDEPQEDESEDIIKKEPKLISLLSFFIYNPVKDIAKYFLKYFVRIEKWIVSTASDLNN